MDMTATDHSRYMKALAISFGPAADVLHLYFENKVLEGKELGDFLNDIKIKHILFHENTPTVPCCECMKFSIAAPKKRVCLENKQFSKFFCKTGTVQQNHIIQHGSIIKQHCLCGYLARTNLAVEELDITMICIMISKCCPSKKQTSIAELKDIRNKLVHQGERQLSISQFEQYRNQLEKATISLAKTVGKSYAKKVDVEIKNLICKDSLEELREIVLKSKEDISQLHSGMNGFHESGDMCSALKDVSNRQKEQGDDIKEMKATLECLLYAQFGKVQTLTDVTHVPEGNESDGKTHDMLVKIKTPADWDKAKLEEKMKERVEKDKSMNSSEEIQLIDFKFKCLLLKTKVSRYLLENRSELMCAIGRFLKSILEDCEIDLQKPETLMIAIDVKSTELLWKDTGTDMVTETQKAKYKTFEVCNSCSVCERCGEKIAAGYISETVIPFLKANMSQSIMQMETGPDDKRNRHGRSNLAKQELHKYEDVDVGRRDYVKDTFLEMLLKAFETSCVDSAKVVNCSYANTFVSFSELERLNAMDNVQFCSEVINSMTVTGVTQVIKFAQLIPEFNSLSEHDQISLLKNGCFEALLVLFSRVYNSSRSTFLFNGKLIDLTIFDKIGYDEKFIAGYIKIAIAIQHLKWLDKYGLALFIAYILTDQVDPAKSQNGKRILQLNTQILSYMKDIFSRDDYEKFSHIMGELHQLKHNFTCFLSSLTILHPTMKLHPLITEMFNANNVKINK